MSSEVETPSGITNGSFTGSLGSARDDGVAKPKAMRGASRTPPIAVIGLEAEFTLYVDEVKRRPEEVFGTPQRLVSQPMLPRTGRSFQLPAGGAIYFDTGVIEVATPIVELGPGCCYRATRLLWEQIRHVREELDRWSARNDCKARLEGFSTHYNFSFTKGVPGPGRTAR